MGAKDRKIRGLQREVTQLYAKYEHAMQEIKRLRSDMDLHVVRLHEQHRDHAHNVSLQTGFDIDGDLEISALVNNAVPIEDARADYDYFCRFAVGGQLIPVLAKKLKQEHSSAAANLLVKLLFEHPGDPKPKKS